MTTRDILQVVLYIALVAALAPPIGNFMARVFTGKRTFLSPLLQPIEMILYQWARVDPADQMTWQRYARALAVFNGAGFTALLILQVAQHALPLNPQQLPNVPFCLAVNTAVSFVTNTNWQAYAGETTMSYLTDTFGLTVQNFLSAATGIAVLLALVRGLTRRSTSALGNFWVDVVRATAYILVPMSLMLGVALVSQGVVQNFAPYTTVTTLEGGSQTIPQGPAASEIAIKQLGTNGGGFFGTNSAFPLENPTPASDFLQMLAMLVLPSALVVMYGVMSGSTRHGWVLWGVMMSLVVLGLGGSLAAEHASSPLQYSTHPMEGKEQRFGSANSIVWSVVTSATANGSVNSMHDSLSPLSGGIALLNIMLGEVLFGGVGSGLYGMILLVVLTVFIAGLMVGRTPEYLGKKIEAREIKLAILGVLAPGATILIGTAYAAVTPSGLAGVTNGGPHGLTQILYAFSSAAGNNGSAFAGLSAGSDFYNLSLAACMLIGRYGVIFPVLAVAGSLAGKNASPATSGTFRTDTILFATLLVGVILIVGALTFFPALALGPIAEHLLFMNGNTF